VLSTTLSGTGGYGFPLERDPEAVLRDVRDDFVSLDAAREQYGVTIDPHTRQVDKRATERLRRKRRKNALKE